jgi:predicted dehydrogenase
MGDCRTRETDVGTDSSRLRGLQVFLSGGAGQRTSREGQAGRRHYGIDAQAIYGYEDFERIKDNGRIDVVYIVLPNSMHAEYTIRALQSGKHVLCEKPMAASLAECEAMIDASRKARGSSASPIVCTMNR